MRFFKVVLASALGYFVAAVIILTIVVLTIIGVASNNKKEVVIPETAVLNLKLNYPLEDRSPSEGIAALASLDPNSNVPVGLNHLLRTIERAKTDDNIKGIILDLTTLSGGYAKLTEVRNKLSEFKESGKFIYAFADYYYYQTYYLGSVADSVFINPEGEMAFTGMVAEVAFFSNALEKLGIDMQVVRAGMYKGAVEPYTRQSLSEANKKQIEIYVNSLFDETLAKIASDRNMEVAKLKADADSLKVRSVTDFIREGYIDAAVYRDQLYSTMKKRIGVDDDQKVALISESKYSKKLGMWGDGDEKIAIVYASGDIVGGKSDGESIAADDMAAALKKARLDEETKAVVFRVDSRGGSALASDIIWREAKLLAAEKPLIVSMGNVAASGGYYISTPATKIVAEPTTITGSIGVFGLIPNAQKLLNDKLGIDFEYVGTGKHSDIGRIDRDMKPSELAYIEEIIDRIYETFLSRVGEGRGMTRDEVHEIAQGRVWTGVMAKEVGLVDELGGLEKAIEIAATEAKLESYKIREYPKPHDPLMEIMNKLQGGSSITAQLSLASESSVFGKYVKYLGDLDKWGSKHSVQMLMPFDLEVKNYHLR